MKTQYVTIVTNKKGSSYHTSWKQACEEYGWDYTKAMKQQVGEYTIKKAPLNVTIDCLDLVEVINRKRTVQSASRVDDVYEIDFDSYGTTYTVTAEYEKKYEPETTGGSDEYGRSEQLGGYDYDVIKKIIKVEVHHEDSPIEIPIDPWTAGQLIDKIDTLDYE